MATGRATCVRSEQGLECWLATDTGFDRRVLGPALAETDGWALPQNYRTLRLGDINGDNRADICGRSRMHHAGPYEGGGFGCGEVMDPSGAMQPAGTCSSATTRPPERRAWRW
ncbi:MAG: hypothetical protein R3B07_02120 [Polyangiaceae bacterium]